MLESFLITQKSAYLALMSMKSIYTIILDLTMYVNYELGYRLLV